jgi:hypothetical protein
MKALIEETAANMLVGIIDQVYAYNGLRRGCGNDEIHYRTLELLKRFAEKKAESHMQDRMNQP